MLSRWMESVDFVATDDFGKHVITHVPRGNKFVVSEQFTLVAQCTDVQSQTVNLMVRKHGTGKEFEKALIPTHLVEKSYAILDASEGFVLLHVNHGEGLGNVYVSDDSGTRYVLSLQHNVGVNGRAAFEKVSNLQGIYFANVWATENATGIEALPSTFAESGWLEHGDYQVGEGSTMSQSEQSIRYLKARPTASQLSSRRLAPKSVSIHSLISFNAGGAWGTLTPPRTDSLNQPIACGKGCSLHLHDMTFQDHFVPFYSYDKAVGIIMAAGNVGQRLSYQAEESNTYLSRDGGLSWSEVRKGEDGHDDKPDDPGSDYETWAPTDGFKHKCKHGACGCLLGMQVAYVRRKQLKKCFNRRKTKLPVISQPCRCTQEDYECELDFVRALDQQSCVATVMPPPRARFGPSEQRECEIAKSYKVDMYRRVPGNRLYGWTPPQLEIACPLTVDQASQSHSGVLKLILVAVAFGGCLYMGKKGAGEGWTSWSNPYTSFSSPGTASGRSIGRVAVPTELPEVAVPRYQAPSLVQF
eukprot:Skav213736  [mRNA]  locus=scaffold2563:358062:361340:+ [translate_table: standard]